MTTVNERIRQLRQYHKLTQKQFSQKLGISREHLCRIESSKEKPSEQTLLLILALFNINTSWLFDGLGEMTNNSCDETSPELLSKSIKDITNTIKISNYNQSSMIESIILLNNIFKEISEDNEKIEIIYSIIENLNDIVNKSNKLSADMTVSDFKEVEALKTEINQNVSYLFFSNN